MLNLKELRRKANKSQQELADYLGITQTAYSRYERNTRQPDVETLQKLAEYFGVTVDQLLNSNEHIPNWAKGIFNKEKEKEYSLIPILGCVRAGYDSYADQELLGYIEVEQDYERRFPGCFALKVKGDSMQPEFFAGDTVIVRPCSQVRTGDIAIVCINGDEGTVKRVVITPEGLELVPSNRNYGALKFTKEQVDDLPVTICGQVIEVRRKYVE